MVKYSTPKAPILLISPEERALLDRLFPPDGLIPWDVAEKHPEKLVELQASAPDFYERLMKFGGKRFQS